MISRTQRQSVQFDIVVQSFDLFDVVIICLIELSTKEKFPQIGEVLHAFDLFDGAVA